jgi:hypothetical protein
MVEIFTKRTELMPADESVEQHNMKRTEEIAHVEKDKNSPDGLFKGTFPPPKGQPVYDEEDNVFRCPHCSHEHSGGPSCLNCGAGLVDDGGFSDVDDDFDVDDLELDLDEELQAEIGIDVHDHFFGDLPAGLMAHEARRYADMARQHRLMYHRRHIADISNSEDSDLDSEDDDDSSLQDFVVRDDEEPPRSRGQVRRPRNRRAITVSDDESDEGGAVSARRPLRRNIAASITSSIPSSSLVSTTEDSNNGSEAGDMHSEADLLRTAGWSPLDHGTDSEPDAPNEYQYNERRGGYESTLDGNDSEDDSDTNTETMAGNAATDDEDDHLRDDMSETPTYDGPDTYHPEFSHYGHDIYEHLGDDTDDDSSDAQSSVMMDHDGDTEMSASPDARQNSSVNTNPYRHEAGSRPSREPHVSMNRDSTSIASGRDGSISANSERNGYQYHPEALGPTNQVPVEAADDSSDASIRPAQRRRRPRYRLHARVMQYDPRISMIFAAHQQSVQGSTERTIELEELDEWARFDVRRVIEPSSRNRRMTAYRMMPARRTDPLRSSRSPSATRVISSTDRTARMPRQYARSRN